MKIKITYETQRLLIVRSRDRTRAWCNECGEETDFVPNDELDNLASRITRNTKKPVLHKVAAGDGKTLFCLASLLKNGN